MTDADKLGLGLDDIIRQDRTMNRRGGRGGRRPFRGRGGGRLPQTTNAPMGRWKHDLFSTNAGRGQVRQRNSGVSSTTKLIISNLDYGVTSNDIQELFEVFGAVRSAHVHFDENGQSLGTAEVIFERRVDALTAQNKYNGVDLDSRPMDIRMVGDVDNGALSQSNRGSYNNGVVRGGNRRGGFGYRGGNNRMRGGQQQTNDFRANGTKETVTADDLDADLDAYRAQGTQKKQ